jgi:peptide/nickel transport system substrate-binding protein
VSVDPKHPRGTRPAVRPSLRLVALLAAVSLAAVACGSDDDGATEPEGSEAANSDRCTNDQPQSDLTMGLFSETLGLDPIVSRGTGVTGGTELASIYDTLMRWDPEAGEYEPRVAESVEPNADLTEWTLTVKDGIEFGNGDPLTTTAVKASIERFQNAPTSRWHGLSLNVADMELVDDLTMVFHLTAPWAAFPYLMAHEVGMIVNPAVVEQLGDDELNRNPVGAGVGAFEPVRLSPGEEIVMAGKADYWGGPVCIDQLRFVVIPGGEATYDALRTGELDVAFIRDPKAVADARADGFPEFATPQNAGALFMMNHGVGDTNPPTADPRVRRAVAHAIDPNIIDDRVWDGSGNPTGAVFGPASRFNSIDGPGFDPEQARALVDEVKAEGDWDGSIRVLGTSDPAGTEIAITAEAMLEAVGFDVQVDVDQDVQQMIEQVNAGQFDLVGWGLNVDESNPWMKLDAQLVTANIWGLHYPELESAIEQVKVAADDEELAAATEQVQEVWNDVVPGAVYGTIEEVVFWSDAVHGIELTQEANVLLAGAYVTP